MEYDEGWILAKPIWEAVEEKFDEYLVYKHGHDASGVSRLHMDGYLSWSNNYEQLIEINALREAYGEH